MHLGGILSRCTCWLGLPHLPRAPAGSYFSLYLQFMWVWELGSHWSLLKGGSLPTLEPRFRVKVSSSPGRPPGLALRLLICSALPLTLMLRDVPDHRWRSQVSSTPRFLESEGPETWEKMTFIFMNFQLNVAHRLRALSAIKNGIFSYPTADFSDCLRSSLL